MQIQFTRDVLSDTKEILYHKGESAHVPTSVGENLIFNKAAVKILPRNYVERLKAAAAEFAVSQPPAKVEWGIHKGSGDNVIAIVARCSRPMCSVLRYDKSPTPWNTIPVRNVPSARFDPALIEFHHSCGANPERIPADVLKRYAAEKNGEQIEVTPDMGIFHKIVNFVGDSNKHREIESAPRK